MDEIVPKMNTIPALRCILPRAGSRVYSREGSELKILEFHCVVSAKPPVDSEQWLWMGNIGEILLKYRKAYGTTWRLTIVSVCACEKKDKYEVVSVWQVLII